MENNITDKMSPRDYANHLLFDLESNDMTESRDIILQGIGKMVADADLNADDKWTVEVIRELCETILGVNRD